MSRNCNSVKLRYLSVIRYIPSNRRSPNWPPWAKNNQEGRPQGIELMGEKAIQITFLHQPNLEAFMHAISGWTLQFQANAQKFHLQSRHKINRSSGRAQITIWSKLGELRVLVGLYGNERAQSISKWVTARVETQEKRCPYIEQNPRNQTFVRVRDIRASKGRYILRSSMLAATGDQLKEEQLRFVKQEYEFENPSTSRAFIDVLAPYTQLGTDPRSSIQGARPATEPDSTQSHSRRPSDGSDSFSQPPLAPQRTYRTT